MPNLLTPQATINHRASPQFIQSAHKGIIIHQCTIDHYKSNVFRFLIININIGAAQQIWESKAKLQRETSKFC